MWKAAAGAEEASSAEVSGNAILTDAMEITMKHRMHSILSLCAILFCAFSAHNLFASNDVEVLHGAQALAHLKNLKARRAAAFALATKLMEGRGFKPTDIVTVIRSTSAARLSPSGTRSDLQRVQTGASDSSGEVDLWSWDDGDPSTWEGVVYFEDYSTGASFTGNTQIDISGSESVLWEQQVSYSSGGGSIDRRFTSLTPLENGGPAVQIASVSPDFAADLVARQPVFRVQAGARIMNFLICFINRCIVHVTQCRMSGPFWADCSIGFCAVDAIICAVGALK